MPRRQPLEQADYLEDCGVVFPEEENVFWAGEQPAVTFSLDLPKVTTKQGKEWTRDMGCYFVKQLKRQAVEVSEKRLSEEELLGFRTAKQKEVKNFVVAQAFRALPQHLKPNRSQVMKMRWLLTWKLDNEPPPGEPLKRDASGNPLKPKARAVVLGYMDPEYEYRPTSSPTMGRSTRQMLLMDWWRHQFSGTCPKDRTPIGWVCGHVDDFMFGGDHQDPEWMEIRRQIQERFKWGQWETKKFTQCGVLIEQTSDGFLLSQPEYLNSVSEIHVGRSRHQDLTAEVTNHELLQLRSVLGALSWHATQVAPQWCAPVGMLLSRISKGTIQEIVDTNKLLRRAKLSQHHKMRIHGFPREETLLAAWADAADGHRPDGSSTKGVFIGWTTSQLLKGDLVAISPMFWQSAKIQRTCKSSGAAETRAAADTEDELYALRFQAFEFQGGQVSLWNCDYMEAATTYKMLFSVTSRWGLTTVKEVMLTKLNFPAPMVSINGPAQINRRRPDRITLEAVGIPSACANASNNLGYRWIATSGNLNFADFPDIITSASTLAIPPFVLEPDTTNTMEFNVYNFTVECFVNTVQGNVPERTASATVTVRIYRSDVYVVYRTASRMVTKGDILVLDVRGSQDPDYPTLEGQTFRGTFVWSCFTPPPERPLPEEWAILPDFGCLFMGYPDILDDDIGTQMQDGGVTFFAPLFDDLIFCRYTRGVIMFQTQNFSSGEYKFSVQAPLSDICRRFVATSYDGRQASEDVYIEMTDVQVPKILLTVANAQAKYPISFPIQISGTEENNIARRLQISAETREYSWTVLAYYPNPDYDPDLAEDLLLAELLNDPNNPYTVDQYKYVDQSDRFDTRDQRLFRTDPSLPNIIIQPNVLQPSTKYKFRLNIHLTNVTGYSDIVIETAGLPPRSGRLEVTPVNATMDTPRVLSAPNWVATDLPLTYNFGYIKFVEGNPLDSMFNTDRQQVSSKELPRLVLGEASTNYTVHLFVEVYTPYGAFSRAEVAVQSLPVENLTQAVIDGLDNAQNADASNLVNDLDYILSLDPDAGTVQQVIDILDENVDNIPTTPTQLERTASTFAEIVAGGQNSDQVLDLVESLVQTSANTGAITLESSLAGTFFGIFGNLMPPPADGADAANPFGRSVLMDKYRQPGSGFYAEERGMSTPGRSNLHFLHGDIYKKHISADKVPERLPYEIDTALVELHGWKRFELNQFVGVTEENIYSILRRAAACRYKAFFVDGARIAGKEQQAAARGVRILELGAGTGWLGLSLVTAFPDLGRLLLTETPIHLDALDHLQRTVKLNMDLPGADKVEVAALDWADVDASAVCEETWDLILGSDLVYSRDTAYCQSLHRWGFAGYDIPFLEGCVAAGLVPQALWLQGYGPCTGHLERDCAAVEVDRGVRAVRQQENHEVAAENQYILSKCDTAFCDRVGLACSPEDFKPVSFFTCCNAPNSDTLCNDPPCWFHGNKCPVPIQGTGAISGMRRMQAKRQRAWAPLHPSRNSTEGWFDSWKQSKKISSLEESEMSEYDRENLFAGWHPDSHERRLIYAKGNLSQDLEERLRSMDRDETELLIEARLMTKEAAMSYENQFLADILLGGGGGGGSWELSM
eukprot:s1465_g1.t2